MVMRCRSYCNSSTITNSCPSDPGSIHRADATDGISLCVQVQFTLFPRFLPLIGTHFCQNDKKLSRPFVNHDDDG